MHVLDAEKVNKRDGDLNDARHGARETHLCPCQLVLGPRAALLHHHCHSVCVHKRAEAPLCGLAPVQQLLQQRAEAHKLRWDAQRCQQLHKDHVLAGVEGVEGAIAKHTGSAQPRKETLLVQLHTSTRTVRTKVL